MLSIINYDNSDSIKILTTVMLNCAQINITRFYNVTRNADTHFKVW
jgi:hypothetical protein